MNKKWLLLFGFILLTLQLIAQDDLLKLLAKDSLGVHLPVLSTFNGSRIINVQTNETVKGKNLDFRVSHLFGNVGKKSGGGVHNLFGLDQSQDIRLAFQYGISNKLTVGIGRSKRFENLDGMIKYKLLEQTTDRQIPVSISVYSNMTYSTRSGAVIENDLYRFTYCTELIFARKFNSHFSMVVVPSFLHRNFVMYYEQNKTFALSSGFRWKFTPSSSIIVDYSHTFNVDQSTRKNYNVLGAGVEIETGGHVFSIMFSNASGILENDFLVNTTDNWSDGGFKLSFIISRVFRMDKQKKKD